MEQATAERAGGGPRSRPVWLGWSPRRWVKASIDGVGVTSACLFAVLLRYDFSPGKTFTPETVAISVSAGLVAMVVGSLIGLYKGRWKFGSFEELGYLIGCLAATFAIVLLAEVAVPRLRAFVPLGAVLLCAGFALMALAALRYGWRLADDRRLLRAAQGGRRVLVAGAGEGGEQIVRALRAHPEKGRLP